MPEANVRRDSVGNPGPTSEANADCRSRSARPTGIAWATPPRFASAAIAIQAPGGSWENPAAIRIVREQICATPLSAESGGGT
jgi:hypothetical protein